MAEDENKSVPFGTPLEPFDEDDVPKKKPVRLEDQIVTDEKGRRRFHGAFTGGFSAGYFNSVGSLEGWSPAHFKSTRASRAVKKEKCPEDFMDAEDVGTFGIAPRTIHTTKPFTAPEHEEKKRKRPFSELNFGPIPFDGFEDKRLKDLVVPLNSSIGVKLLYKMGWKHGQGIGPRVKIKKKKKIQTSEVENDAENVRVYGCALPPASDNESDDEFANFTFAPKDVEIVQYVAKENQQGLGYQGLDKRPVLSSTLRIFDENPVMLNRKKNLGMKGQAFGVGAFENDDDDIYAIEDMSNYNFTEPSQVIEKKAIKSKDESSSKTPQNKILEGFQLATKPPPAKKHFPLPSLPRNYIPKHKPIPTPDISVIQKPPERKKINSFERGAALGEKVDPASVFNFISPHDKARLDAIRLAIETSKNAKPTISENLPAKVKVEAVPQKPIIPGKFKPFATDKNKQRRYEKFLAAESKDSFTSNQPTSMTEWEKVRELEEFQKAAQLYRPMAAGIASRFVSARELEQQDEPSASLALPEKVDPDKIDLLKAVEMKMFGRLTHQKVDWYPDKLLCKRFNIPNPYPDSNDVGVKKEQKKGISIFNFLTMETLNSTAETIDEKDQNEQDNEEAEENEEDDVQEEIAELEEKKPPMDLFKAIFQDSDKESEPDSENDEREENENEIEVEVEELMPVSQPIVVEQTVSVSIPIPQSPPEMFYGPKLPPASTTSVEIKNVKQPKSETEKRKHKHKKHKKHKHKRKHTSEKNSDDSDSQSPEEVSAKEILNRIKNLQKRKRE